MPDRIEREIEEILARIGEDDPPGRPRGHTNPIPISSAKRRRRPDASSGLVARIDPPTLMFAGAGVMLAGLLLSTALPWLIWMAFAGVVMFIAAFLVSFARGWPSGQSRGGASSPGRAGDGVFWRDRYIQYDEAPADGWARIKRKFRR